MTNRPPPPPLAGQIGRWLGPTVFVVLFLSPTGGLEGPAKAAAGVALWMAVWWVTEAAPLAATSLLPLILFPLLGVRPISQVSQNYGHHMVFLFFGGFALALTIERSGLHRRVALAVLESVGASPRRLIWGFLLVTAGLSMWLSNTATALMLLPIAGGVAIKLEDDLADTRLFLAVAYGASVGGMATLVGTPPNLVLAGMAPTLVPDLPGLTFGGWMLFGLPLVMVLLPILGLRLGRGLKGGGGAGSSLAEERRSLGPISTRERRAAVLFALTAFAWITRPGFDFGVVHLPGWSALLPDPKLVSDAVPAIAAAALATILPAGDRKGARLLEWDDLHRGIPWGILILFGGGFALADSVQASGLGLWLARQLEGLNGLPLPLIILSLCLFATFTTELTSNTATATLLLPVMAALSEVLEVPPYLLMAAVTVSCSCAFMLPVATPPNAIVIGSGRVTPQEMFREGLWLNFVVAAVVTAFVLVWGRLVLPI